MKNCKILLAAAAMMAVAACTPKAHVNGTVSGLEGGRVVVKQLNVNQYQVLDTLKTDGSGRFSCSVKVEEGQPEFVDIFYGDQRIAALLLQKGDRVDVQTDTLGNCTVTGSDESVKLQEVQKAYSQFIYDMYTETDPAKLGQIYVKHYRQDVRYVMENPFSLTIIPVLYETLDQNTPVFSQATDAIHFRRALDSLKTVYPDSRYVKALQKETERREGNLELQTMISNAGEQKFPDINLPNVDGTKVALSSVDAKVIMVHFWNPEDASHKMFNLDVLKKIYSDFHARGFEIYAVAVDTDKASWASIVKSQELPWINVNDGLGTASPALATYNVAQIPASFIISDGDVLNASIKGENALRKLLQERL